MATAKKDENRCIITRKYTLIPVASDTKEWTDRIYTYLTAAYPEKIRYYEDKLKALKKEAKTDNSKQNAFISCEDKIAALKTQQQNFENEGVILSSNIKDYAYDLVRRSMKSEALRKNMIWSYIFTELVNADAQNMPKTERAALIDELLSYALHIKGSSKGSLWDQFNIDNPLKGYGIAFNKALTAKIKKAVNNEGLLEGKCAIPNYKLDSPFTIAKQIMSFSHDFDSFEELQEHIAEENCPLYFNLGPNGNPTIARFKIDLGTGHKKSKKRNNREELIATLLKIYSKEYQFLGSSIGIEKNKITLNLSLSIPKESHYLDENVVVGVDLGVAIPAVCALNNDSRTYLKIGSKEDFLHKQNALDNQRRRAQAACKYASGGHGRKKKCQKLGKINISRANFSTTYCHYVSKSVVDFALEHHAKYINIENLEGYNTSYFVLAHWNYYRMQQDIIYKAERYGIIVRKINPCYTSQVCSVCGHWEPGQRLSQAKFECADENCDSKTMYKYGFNADFNAARNISMSTLIMDGGRVTEEDKMDARRYYGIPMGDLGEEDNKMLVKESTTSKKASKKKATTSSTTVTEQKAA